MHERLWVVRVTAYRCARCGRRLIRPGIEDAMGASYGPTCAETVGLIVVRAKRKAAVSRRLRVQADTRTVPMFEGVTG